ncbi:MAG: hypothetical protein ABSF96_07650 [Steroidobacteraceae bacterium]|jgi:hypothetical protein
MSRAPYLPLAVCLIAFASSAQCNAVADAQSASARLQSSPSVTISNGLIEATIALPDAATGFYRGTRFDWSGMITKLCHGGQRFYGPWFDQISPTVRDFTYDGDRLVASTASAATGPVEEFAAMEDPLGFDAAKPGDSFVKIGIGALRRPDLAEYDHYRAYDFVDHGRWRWRKIGQRSLVMSQELADRGSGYAYSYIKRIDLVAGAPRMIISHSLTNRGHLRIRNTVYDHNFLTLDNHPTESGLTLELPFTIQSDVPVDNAAIAGNRLTLARTPGAHESIAIAIRGFGPGAADNRIVMISANRRAAVTVTTDKPLEKLQFWSIQRVAAIEPFIRLDAAAGRSVQWRYSYDYRADSGAASACPK